MNKFLYIFGIIFSTNMGRNNFTHEAAHCLPQNDIFTQPDLTKQDEVVASIYIPIISKNGSNDKPGFNLYHISGPFIWGLFQNNTLCAGFSYIFFNIAQLVILTSCKLNMQVFQMMFLPNTPMQFGLRFARDANNFEFFVNVSFNLMSILQKCGVNAYDQMQEMRDQNAADNERYDQQKNEWEADNRRRDHDRKKQWDDMSRDQQEFLDRYNEYDPTPEIKSFTFTCDLITDCNEKRYCLKDGNCLQKGKDIMYCYPSGQCMSDDWCCRAENFYPSEKM